MSDARRKQQRRRSQLSASNWENLCLLRMSSITPHQTTARPVLRESQKSVFVHKYCYIFSNWKIAFLYLTFWIHLPALQVSVCCQKYDYCLIKTSFCALHVPSVFLVTVTYSSCHEPDGIFFLISLFFLLLAPQILPPTHPPIKSERLPGSLFEQTHFPSTDTQRSERETLITSQP